MTSRYSTFDDGDKQIITIAFIWLFGANYLIKLIAHHGLKRKIKEIINLNFMLNPIPLSSQFIACNEKKPQKIKT